MAGLSDKLTPNSSDLKHHQILRVGTADRDGVRVLFPEVGSTKHQGSGGRYHGQHSFGAQAARSDSSFEHKLLSHLVSQSTFPFNARDRNFYIWYFFRWLSHDSSFGLPHLLFSPLHSVERGTKGERFYFTLSKSLYLQIQVSHKFSISFEPNRNLHPDGSHFYPGRLRSFPVGQYLRLHNLRRL